MIFRLISTKRMLQKYMRKYHSYVFKIRFLQKVLLRECNSYPGPCFLRRHVITAQQEFQSRRVRAKRKTTEASYLSRFPARDYQRLERFENARFSTIFHIITAIGCSLCNIQPRANYTRSHEQSEKFYFHRDLATSREYDARQSQVRRVQRRSMHLLCKWFYIHPFLFNFRFLLLESIELGDRGQIPFGWL